MPLRLGDKKRYGFGVAFNEAPEPRLVADTPPIAVRHHSVKREGLRNGLFDKSAAMKEQFCSHEVGLLFEALSSGGRQILDATVP